MNNKNNNQNHVNLYVSLVEDAIRSRKLALLKTLNCGLIELFWNIGKLINESVIYEDEDLDRQLSIPLSSQYGTYLSKENLSIMKEFAKNCPVESLRDLALNVSWEHIPVINKLANSSDWLYYVNIMQREQLSPFELANRAIPEKTSSQQVESQFFYKKIDKKFMENYIEKLRLYTYFGDKGQDFRKLFEPHYKINETKNKDAIGQLIDTVLLTVAQFQKDYHATLHLMGTASLEYIAQQLLTATKILSEKLDSGAVIDHITQQFNTTEISQWLAKLYYSAQSQKNNDQQVYGTVSADPTGKDKNKNFVQKKGNKEVILSVNLVEPEANKLYNIYQETDIFFLLAKV